MKEERLFDAIGAADPALLERSEKRHHRRRPWAAAGLAAAACAALVWVFTSGPSGPPAPSTNSGEGTPLDPPPQAEVIQLTGSTVGELHLAQLSYGPERPPDFVIYVNEEIYQTSEENGGYVIRPVVTLPEGEYPPIDLTVTHRPGVAPKTAAAEKAAELAESYAEVSAVEERTDGHFVLTAGDGWAWNAAQTDVTCVSDRQGGSFILTSRYFTEAAEGHGVRFWDMVGTFQVVTTDEKLAAPAWMDGLRNTTARLMTAFFDDRMEDAADLLAEGAWIGTYGEDVSAWVSVAAVDYRPDDDQAPTSAVVSIKHRISTEDSYNYLTMELSCTDGTWLLEWAGLEK